VTRKFRGATYHITVKNPKNIESVDYTVTVDGSKAATNVLPVAPAGSTVNVEVIIG
jgi:cellobiose phosphorylase